MAADALSKLVGSNDTAQPVVPPEDFVDPMDISIRVYSYVPEAQEM